MIQVTDIVKSFGKEKVLQDVSFSLQETRTLSILGKSGSGKTTLLKILSGIVTPDGGNFTVGELDMLALPAQKRGVVYLSQEPLLFPHMNVYENLAFGLRIRKIIAPEIEERVEAMALKLEVQDHLKKFPTQLSGGQNQRVSFGRALIIHPKIMLLDEPFGSLDTQTRGEMQELFNQVRKSFGITSLFVTHDLKEALTMGDEMALMAQGRLKQYSSIKEFMEDPSTGVAKEMTYWESLKSGMNQ